MGARSTDSKKRNQQYHIYKRILFSMAITSLAETKFSRGTGQCLFCRFPAWWSGFLPPWHCELIRCLNAPQPDNHFWVASEIARQREAPFAIAKGSATARESLLQQNFNLLQQENGCVHFHWLNEPQTSQHRTWLGKGSTVQRKCSHIAHASLTAPLLRTIKGACEVRCGTSSINFQCTVPGRPVILVVELWETVEGGIWTIFNSSDSELASPLQTTNFQSWKWHRE